MTKTDTDTVEAETDVLNTGGGAVVRRARGRRRCEDVGHSLRLMPKSYLLLITNFRGRRWRRERLPSLLTNCALTGAQLIC